LVHPLFLNFGLRCFQVLQQFDTRLEFVLHLLPLVFKFLGLCFHFFNPLFELGLFSFEPVHAPLPLTSLIGKLFDEFADLALVFGTQVRQASLATSHTVLRSLDSISLLLG